MVVSALGECFPFSRLTYLRYMHSNYACLCLRHLGVGKYHSLLLLLTSVSKGLSESVPLSSVSLSQVSVKRGHSSIIKWQGSR